MRKRVKAILISSVAVISLALPTWATIDCAPGNWPAVSACLGEVCCVFVGENEGAASCTADNETWECHGDCAADDSPCSETFD